MSEDELSIENLTLCCEGVTQRSHPSRGYGYTRTKAIPSPTSSPATHTGSCITAPTHPSSSPTISTYQFNLGRRHASVNGFSNSPTLSDSTRHSPASKPAPYSASAVASTLSRYRHGRNASLDLIDPIHHQLDFASVKFTHRTTSSDTPSSPINPRPVSRQFLPRPRPHTRGNSIYSCRVPTQILINNLIAQLERVMGTAPSEPTLVLELAAYDSAPDRWAHFKAIKSALLELEAAQADGQFPPVEVTAAQFRRRFDHMVLWLEGAHAQRLARDAAEKARRAETGGADPFHHLTGDFRRLALQGAHPFLLPPHTYPAELPLFHVEPVHSNERGWGLQLIEDVKVGSTRALRARLRLTSTPSSVRRYSRSPTT
ncbi:hypothetical protein L0F63_002914 [Massospora cicadina]|nr:hypothetical protein L0F63_002914 [Massospora cicadina]